MTIGFNTLFSQRDVRITPTSTATATAVGLTDPLYLCLSTDADLNNERVLTAGGGIDFTDNGAGGTLIITGEDATTSNKGICSFTEGEGINISITAGDVDISGENASTTNKGVASFNTNHFTISSGAVSSRVSAGEGIDVSATQVVSGEDATTTNKGIAAFDTNHFTTSSGTASLNNTVVDAINANTTHSGSDGSDHSLLANKTSYLSIPGNAFEAEKPATETVDKLNQGRGALRDIGAVGYQYLAPVYLPHGAVVTGAIVYANDADMTWSLWRNVYADYTAGGDTMASAVTNTEDTSISNATVNNQTHKYMIEVTSMSPNDYIAGARITYTTDYD